MPAKRIPSYRLHKASGQAVVTLDGRDHYLGPFDSPKSHEAYGRTIAAWKAGTLATTRRPQEPQGPTVAAVVVAFLEHVEKSGRYTKNGKPTSERQKLALAVRPLVRLFGGTPASEFGPLQLIAVRHALVHRDKRTDRPRGRWIRDDGPMARETVNAFIDRIVRVFRWATSMQLVPVTVWQALGSVDGLRAGESEGLAESRGVHPVAPRSVALTLRQVDQKVGAMIRLQWLTGMRPAEVCRLRWCDVDRRGPVWIYRPTLHKTEHHGRDRLVMLGPRCQRILAPFLQLDPAAWIFRTRLPQPIGVDWYRDQIGQACEDAGIERWSPNQLRHAAATRARARDGLEVAGILLGHSNLATTQVYAERDLRKAIEVAGRHG